MTDESAIISPFFSLPVARKGLGGYHRRFAAGIPGSWPLFSRFVMLCGTMVCCSDGGGSSSSSSS